MEIFHLHRQFFGRILLAVCSQTCKGMLLRQGCSKIKHLSTKQLWAQGATLSYGISVEKIPRSVNAADSQLDFQGDGGALEESWIYKTAKLHCTGLQ